MKIVKRVGLVALVGCIAIVVVSAPYFLLFLPMLFGHELAHAVTAATFGTQVKRLGLGMGPVTRILGTFRGLEVVISKYPIGLYVGLDAKTHNAMSRAQRLGVAFSGIIYNLIFAAIAFAIGLPEVIWKTSFLLATMNMLPVLPLDGGVAVAQFMDNKRRKAFVVASKRTFVPAIVAMTLISFTF